MQDASLDLFLARVRPPWFRAAACRQPHHGPGAQPNWHAKGISAEGKVALAICARCPVRQLCADHVRTLGIEGEFGIWGGEAASTRESKRTGYQRPPAA